MKQNEIKIGGIYVAKVTNKLTEVRITGVSQYGGWDAVNTATNKTIRIKSAQRLRREVGVVKPKASPEHMKAVHKADQENARLDEERAKADDGMAASERAMAATAPQKADVAPSATKKPKAATEPKKARKSGLNAAALVLAETDKPMKVSDILAVVAEKNLWSTGGKTPEATVYAAIIREIKAKGPESRFWKVDKGTFGITDAGKAWVDSVA